MQTPTHVYFDGVPRSDAIETLCQQELDKLERFDHRAVACRVTISQDGQRHESGGRWRVHLLLSVPGNDLVVDRDPPEHAPDETLEQAVRAAFDRLERQLRDRAEKLEDRRR